MDINANILLKELVFCFKRNHFDIILLQYHDYVSKTLI